MKRFIILSLTFVVGGCAGRSEFIPDNYIGDTAIINDTYDQYGHLKADIYYVESIDGKEIVNAIDSTLIATQNDDRRGIAGLKLSPNGHHRKVPIQPLQITVVGKKLNINKILRYTSGLIEPVIKGDLQFLPDTNSTYLVKGNLKSEYPGIWLEDGYGNIVSNVIGTIDPNRNSSVQLNKKNNHDRGRNMKDYSNRELFLNIYSGENELFVKEKLGEPDAIGIGQGEGWPGRFSPVTNYFYNNLGTVQFYGKNEPILYANKVIPIGQNGQESGMSDEKSNEKIVLIKKFLIDGNSRDLRDLAKNMYLKGGYDQATLDELSEIIWDQRSTTDNNTVEALSFFCQVLEKSNNPRYRLVLEIVKEEGRTRKLRKYASNCLEKLPVLNTVEQYEPGTSSSIISRKH